MYSRGKKILDMVSSNNKNLLDIPKYESTKTSSRENQSAALMALEKGLFFFANYNDGKELESEEKHIKATGQETENERNNAVREIQETCDLMTNMENSLNPNKKLGVKGCWPANSAVTDNEPDKVVSSSAEFQMSRADVLPINKPLSSELSKMEHFHKNGSDDEPYQSSGSEYIPSESEDDCSSVDLKITGGLLRSKLLDLPSTSGLSKTSCHDPTKNKIKIDGTIATFGKFVSSASKVEHYSNCRPWTRKNTCPYCFQDVTHFARHLKRNHQDEGAVKELNSLSLKNPKRKLLLSAITKQGNFVSNSKLNIVRPVRRPKGEYNHEIDPNSTNFKEKYIVCQSCLGYFTRNYLKRHRKRCQLRTDTSLEAREQHLSSAQVFAVCTGSNSDFYSSLRLKDEVFPIMRNDDISKAAMNDVLICSYAESLLRKHKRPQIKNVISNKLRELGRLLLTIRNATGAQILFETLKPEMFDHFVAATKMISGYNVETRTFKASSLALHMGTTLKQVCDIATKLLIKKTKLLPYDDQEQCLKAIKRLKSLFENHWNSEISSLALKNLNENKYVKPKLMPLTSDIMKFHQYVLKQAEEAKNKLLSKNHSKMDYRLLSECVLALTLLLNRKRIGEVQYLTLNNYNGTLSQTVQEEFLQVLSESERTLTKSFKRVVTSGKGSKPVPLLFSKNIQQLIQVLLTTRNLYISKTNHYLFANTTTDRWLSGYHAVKKLAEKSGVSDKTLFTSTRLRKQIATVLQVLNVTESEFEQFARFMGHTKKTHSTYYRLSQDVYETAKVSKMLLAINSGKGHKYKGKTMEEIEISDDFETDSDAQNEEGIADKESDICAKLPNEILCETIMSEESDESSSSTPQTSETKSKKQNRKTKDKKTLKSWTDKQKKIIKSYFKNHIKNKKAPRKHEVEEFKTINKNDFKDKNWVQIKSYVYNCYKDN